MNMIYEILESLRPEADFHNSKDFVGDGYLDSFDIVSLIAELENRYEIIIDAFDIVPENFVNVESIENLIKKSGGKI